MLRCFNQNYQPSLNSPKISKCQAFSIQARGASKCITNPMEMHSLARRACTSATSKLARRCRSGREFNSNFVLLVEILLNYRKPSCACRGSQWCPVADPFSDVRINTPRFETNQSEAICLLSTTTARFTRRQLASKESSKECSRRFHFR